MCNIWKEPTTIKEEVTPSDLSKLPDMFFTNLAGGEIFLREDLSEIIEVLLPKSGRIALSTNGYLTDTILSFAEKYRNIAIRISLDGFSYCNDHIRGTKGAFDSAMRTFLGLKKIGIKDIGFSITLQDKNWHDLIPLYELAKSLGAEFATGVVQNAFYFKKTDNLIQDTDNILRSLDELINRMLLSTSPKQWLRAYYNDGLKSVVNNHRRPYPCKMARSGGFVTDPLGNVLPCNVLAEFLPLGNLKKQTWNEIWNGSQAKAVRQKVANCQNSCWSIGNIAPDIWLNPFKSIKWVLQNKTKAHFSAGSRKIA
jgi:MoaA/NifB/PqqE/SkfB family radical SAM enzyme